MSKKQTASEPTEAPQAETRVEVRALVDSAAHGMQAGCLALIDRDLIAPLKAAGAIDDHPEAVAAAKAL